MALGNRRAAGDAHAITEGVIWKQLLIFFFPILLGTFFQQLYNTADAIIVGKFVGKEGLAAVGGTTGTLINLLVGFFTGLSSGATVILSQYYGARDNVNVSRTVHTAIALALAGGLVLSAVGIIISPTVLRMMNTPDDVLPLSITYIRIYFCGTIASLVYNIGAGILRAVGDSRRPLIFLICSCMINILLDIILVLGLEMGVAGAALATILSQLFSASLVIATLLRSHHALRLHVSKIRFHKDLLSRVVRIGLPAGLQSVMYSLSNLIVQASINVFGTDMMAAKTAFGKIDSMFWMIIQAYGVSITTFVGQNFGAMKYDRMRRSVRVCMFMAACTTVVVSTLVCIFGRPLYSLFTSEPVVIENGMMILNRLAPFYITFVCVEILAGTLRGAGDSLLPMLITLFGTCILRMIWVQGIAPSHHDVLFTLLCYPISWSTTSCLFVLYYFKGGWLNRCRIKAGHIAAPIAK